MLATQVIIFVFIFARHSKWLFKLVFHWSAEFEKQGRTALWNSGLKVHYYYFVCERESTRVRGCQPKLREKQTHTHTHTQGHIFTKLQGQQIKCLTGKTRKCEARKWRAVRVYGKGDTERER